MDLQLLQKLPAVQGRGTGKQIHSAPAGSARQMVSAHINLHVIAGAFQVKLGAAGFTACRPRRGQRGQGELTLQPVSEG